MCPSHPKDGSTAGHDRCAERNRLHSTALAIILAIGAFGCSSTGSLEPLQVTLVDLQITFTHEAWVVDDLDGRTRCQRRAQLLDQPLTE